MKLVNNSFNEMVNCQARIINDRYNKIVLVTKRDIKCGEELFFDYGYSDSKKQDIQWMQYFLKKYLFVPVEDKILKFSPPKSKIIKTSPENIKKKTKQNQKE